ncbi:MAG TPA: glycosyltransferase [Miltoncostaeaceae bacterium]|nr:glycosyltransferase [Miltoncostaeaceae bacterium]
MRRALAIVIPAYNEERRLGPTLEAWRRFLDAEGVDGEIVVADDGSRDGTADLVRAAAAEDGRVRLVALRPNRGKGAAVRAGVRAADAEVIAYVDADLNIAPAHVPAALARIRAGADLVVGRRGLREYAGEERSTARLVAGLAVQVTRRLLVLPTIVDTQAGFKVFRGPLAHEVFAATRIDSFAFDIEALFLARRRGARIVEMPVTAEFRDESTYDLRRHLPPFLRDIARIRLHALRGRYPRRVRGGGRRGRGASGRARTGTGPPPPG